MNVRAIFFFTAVDGDVMFVGGGVVHSLDHTFMGWNLKAALYLNTDDTWFGKMA
jgi:hypothetical protein